MKELHIVEFTETEYALQHPRACRPDLLSCPYNIYLREYKDEPDQAPGRYKMALIDNEVDGYWGAAYVKVEDGG